MTAKQKILVITGKRKKAIAKALVRQGTGQILINGSPVDYYGTDLLRLKIKEPILLAGPAASTVDIHITVNGGGVAGQSEAVRMTIAKGLVEFTKDKNLEKLYLAYDRNLLVADPRRTEPHKPSQSSKGPRHQKQFSKR
jgi:small subunit ribosomal protein S9